MLSRPNVTGGCLVQWPVCINKMSELQDTCLCLYIDFIVIVFNSQASVRWKTRNWNDRQGWMLSQLSCVLSVYAWTLPEIAECNDPYVSTNCRSYMYKTRVCVFISAFLLFYSTLMPLSGENTQFKLCIVLVGSRRCYRQLSGPAVWSQQDNMSARQIKMSKKFGRDLQRILTDFAFKPCAY